MRLNYSTPIKLDLGCGKYLKEGFTGLDIKDFGQDIVWDVRHGIPLPNESVEEVYCSHFLEHLTYSELELVMDELIRIMSQNATMRISVPHSDTTGAYDYAHRTIWNEKAFQGFLPSAGFNIISMESRDGNLIVDVNKR